MDTSKVATSMNLEMGLLNSALPFLKKYVWTVKAKIPPIESATEKMRPDDECLETSINPQRIRNKRGK